MNCSFDVTLTLAELRSAYWLYLRRRWLWRRLALAYAGTTLLYAVIVIGMDAAAWGFAPAWALRHVAQALVIAAAVLAMIIALMFWRLPRLVKRLYDQANIGERATHFEFDAAGLRTANSEATTDIRWNRFVAWAENEQYLLLYRTDAAFITVPKAQVAAETVAALQSAIAAAGVLKR